MHGFDQDNNLEFEDGTGPVSKIDDATGEVVRTTKTLPFASNIQRIPGSDDCLRAWRMGGC